VQNTVKYRTGRKGGNSGKRKDRRDGDMLLIKIFRKK